jgi:hypothetical protein
MSESTKQSTTSFKDWVPYETVATSRLYRGRIRPSLVSAPLLRNWKDTCFNSHARTCGDIFTGTRPLGMRGDRC